MTGDPVELVRDRLSGGGFAPTKGRDKFNATCPVHGGKVRTKSLSVSRGRDGDVLLKCHVDNCSHKEVARALGLDERDLFVDSTGPAQVVPPVTGLKREVAAYSYTDEDGVLLYQAVRLEPKTFRQRRPDGAGWDWSMGDVRKVPYRLPELQAAVTAGRRVFVVEGEKDADRLAGLGVVATCNVGGAGKWLDDYTAHLRGAHVVVIPDNDPPGRDHMREVVASVLPVAASVRLVDLPVAEKGDVSDWLDAGGTIEELKALVEAAADLDDTPAELEPPPEVTYLSEIAREQVTWTWPGRIPRGKLTIIEGDPERAKSTVTLDLAARVSIGREMPDGHQLDEPGGVLLVCAEDDVADTIIPRLLAHDADLSRIATMTLKRDEQGRLIPLSIPEDIPRLEKAVRDVGARLVVIDPITAYLSEEINSHNDPSVRRALTPLADVAQRLRTSIVLVRHLNKDGQQRKALYRGGGSIAFSGAVRSVMVVDRHPDQQDLVVLARVKNNLAVHVPSIGYRIGSSLVYECPRIEWQGQVDIDADTLLRGPDGRLDAPARDEAEAVLEQLLANGPMEAKKVRKLASEAGVAKATLDRAKKHLGVRAKREIDAATGQTTGWTWHLPTSSDSPETPTSNCDALGVPGEEEQIPEVQSGPEHHGMGQGSLGSGAATYAELIARKQARAALLGEAAI